MGMLHPIISAIRLELQQAIEEARKRPAECSLCKNDTGKRKACRTEKTYFSLKSSNPLVTARSFYQPYIAGESVQEGTI